MASNTKQKCKDESTYINILLLGESGTGKSTFINSFANYLQHASLIEAEEESATAKLCCLIPAKFTAVTDDGDLKVINFQKDDNEDKELGNSSTQAARAYVFNFEGETIRLIDTPGINDSRGAITKDRENFENILDYIGQFEHLHAVCFILKPDQTVLTAAFKYCLVELLSRLDRSAAANIMFLFTRTRSTNYAAPETLNCIKKVLKEIYDSEGVTIPLKFTENQHRNCFYFDNEGFNYLVAKQQGVQLGDEERLRESWNISFLSSWALISYITGDMENPPLPPHNIQETVSISKARVLIFGLSKPLADISQLVQDNLEALQRHQESIQKENLTATQLKELLYVPIIDLVETPLNQPVTVCGAAKCVEVYTVAGIKKCHYTQRCHNPCYLNGVQKNIVGDPRLRGCAAMCGTTTCQVCGCDYTAHLHVYYETKATESRIQDMTVTSQLATNEEILKEQGEMVEKLKKRAQEYADEHKEIVDALATFAYYIRKNSICPINDAYEAYLDCLIENESMGLGDKAMLKRYESLKREHVEQKRLLEEAGKIATQNDLKHITSDQIMKIWERLKKLPHTGKKVDTLHRMIVDRQKAEMGEHMEIVHFPTTKKTAKKELSKDNGQDDIKVSIKNCIGEEKFSEAIALMGEFIEKVKQSESILKKTCRKLKKPNKKESKDLETTKRMIQCLVKDGDMKGAILLVWNHLKFENNTYAMEDVYNWFLKVFACNSPKEKARHPYVHQIPDQRPQPNSYNQYYPYSPFPNFPYQHEHAAYRNILDSFGQIVGHQQSSGISDQPNPIIQQSQQIPPQQAGYWSPFAPMQAVHDLFSFVPKLLGSRQPQQLHQPLVSAQVPNNYNQNENSGIFQSNQANARSLDLDARAAPTPMQGGRSVPSQQPVQLSSQFQGHNELPTMQKELIKDMIAKLNDLVQSSEQPCVEAQSTYNNVGAQQATLIREIADKLHSLQLPETSGQSAYNAGRPEQLYMDSQHRPGSNQNLQLLCDYKQHNTLEYQAASGNAFLNNRFDTLQCNPEEENEIDYDNLNESNNFYRNGGQFAATASGSQTLADNESVAQNWQSKLSKSQRKKLRRAAKQQQRNHPNYNF